MPAEVDVDADLCDCAESVLDQAQHLGASDAKVVISRGEGGSVTVRLGELETVERARDQELGVTVYFGLCCGHASSTDLCEESVRRTVEAACQIARHMQKDPCHGLPETSLLAFDYPDLNLFHPWQIENEEATQLALDCENAARADARVRNSEGAELSHYAGMKLLANSAGFMGGYRSSRADISCCVVAVNEKGDQERDYWHSSHRDGHQLESAQSVGERAAERATRRLGARSLPTQTAPVLFEAPVARELVGHFVGAASGSSLYQDASFLIGKMNQQVWADGVRLVERPRLPEGPASAPFDSDGVATSERVVVEDGVLRGWFLSDYSARRLNLKPTGNAGGVRNLSLEMEGEERSWNELVAHMHRGLVVTELLGQGVNTVTGDYSRGAAGFWIEEGAVAYPVHEITIAGRLQDMLRSVVAVGAEQDRRDAIHTGAILVQDMQIAGA